MSNLKRSGSCRLNSVANNLGPLIYPLSLFNISAARNENCILINLNKIKLNNSPALNDHEKNWLVVCDQWV